MKEYNYIKEKELLTDWLKDNQDKITIISHKNVKILSLDDENFYRPHFHDFYRLLYDYGIRYFRRRSIYVNFRLNSTHLYYKIHSSGIAQIIMKDLSLTDGSFDIFIRREKINEILE
jgi:hypothetical protein